MGPPSSRRFSLPSIGTWTSARRLSSSAAAPQRWPMVRLRRRQIDTFNAVSAKLRDAIDKALHETALEIEVSQATVAAVPTNCEDRLKPELPELERLEVFVLEKHDLVLSKAARCYDHDLQQIREIHDQSALSFDLLVERFQDEMGDVVGDPQRLTSEFLTMIDDVFGELKRVEAERKLSVKR
jgi:hypothetical protein